MTIGDYLNNLATKSGISPTDADLVAVLSSPSLSGSNIPDSLVAKFDSALMNIEAAKNNPVVLAAVRAQVYNGVDSELNKSYEELGLEDTVKTELLLEKNTNKRVASSLKKVVELERAKASAGKGDKVEIQKEIDKLNSDIASVKKNHAEEIKQLNKSHEDALLNYDLTSQLNGYNYAFPETMDKSVVTESVKGVINKSLTEKDAKFIRENGALKLVRTSTGLEYFDTTTNTKMDAKSFIESTLAQNKLLAVAKSNTQATTTATTTTTETTPTYKGRDFSSLVAKSLEDMKVGSTDAAV